MNSLLYGLEIVYFLDDLFLLLEESMSCCFTICKPLYIIVYFLLKNTPKE